MNLLHIFYLISKSKLCYCPILSCWDCCQRIKKLKGFCFTLESFLSNEAHRVESDMDSIGFKIMFNKWISRHDTCISVQRYY